ncbi:uncharacterized protein [Mytilus edulis]|uniref:uncharacterized protein n=1 Tax=Mytilus edulis TaxID=6550 RepID=UPI0039EEB0BD
MSVKNIHVVIVLCSLMGTEAINVQMQATPSDGILGQNYLQLRCSYTTVAGEFVAGVNIQAKINGQFKTIATFYTPSVPLNASLTTDGNYLTDRVALTNPTTTSLTDSALMQFSEITCEDEKEYMCQVAYVSSSGSTTSNSGVVNINVKGNPELPDKVPVYVPSAGIEEGNNVVFTCTGNVGKPQGKFRWVRYRRNSNDVIIHETPYESETTTTVQMPGTCTFNGTSQLTLKMEQIDNNVVVRCQVVYQDLPQGSLYVQTNGVNVYYSVRNVQVTKSPSNPSFADGAGPVMLTCTSDGNPAVTNTGYTWYKESRYYVSLGTGSTYVINNVVVNETDNYICAAQNSFNGQTFNMKNAIHIQIDFTTTTETMTTIKTESTSSNHGTSRKKIEKESSTAVISILIAVVAVLTVLQLGEIVGVYILHKKGMVQFKIGKKETVYADANNGSSQIHVYSTMNSAEDAGNSQYNEIH